MRNPNTMCSIASSHERYIREIAKAFRKDRKTDNVLGTQKQHSSLYFSF